MRKFKEVFKTISFQFKNILNDNGKYSLRKSMVLLFCLSVWTLVFQMCTQGFSLWQLFGPIMVLNLLPIMLVMYLFYFVTGKIALSYIITNTLMAILLLVNHFKIKFRDEPLTTADFALGKEAGNIVSNYDISIDTTVIFVIIFCGVSFWYVGKRVKNKRPGPLTSVIGIGVTIALALTSNSLIYKKDSMYNSLPTKRIVSYHESTNVANKGLIYSLLNDVHKLKYEAPEGYSQNAALEILGRYPAEEMPQDAPNVIAVMCEAYTDMQGWSNISFTEENPYAYFNYLKSIGCYGKIFVPGFGGATAITEFEFLTGNNTSAVSSSMPTAYNTIITDDVYSVARLFKDMGYATSSMHPGHPWFYNRQNAYPRMGFDTFTSLDDLEGDIPKIENTYTMDSIAAEMIIKDYGRHLAENPDKGYFNFTVTIQNHGPYADNTLYYGKEFIPKDTAGLTEQEYHIINNYLGGIRDADAFMKTVYEYINTLDEPTVFIIFGDHLPYLDTEENIYDKLGLDIKSDTYEAFTNRQSTDYLIIGNDAYLKNNTPSINGHQETLITSNYLAIKMLQYMNLPLPQYFAFKNELMQYAPVLSNAHNGSDAGFGEQLPEEFNKMYSELKILQYYNLKEYEPAQNSGI